MMNDIVFKKLSTESGLSQCIVTSLLQDSKGFLWIGTHSGLNRFDGYSFQIYKSDPNDVNSIDDQYVFSIYENKKGNLFMGSYNSIFMEYIYDLNIFSKIDLPGCDQKAYISSITEDRRGDIWIATSKSGLFRLDKNRKILCQYTSANFKTQKAISNDNVSALYFSEMNSRLYIGTIFGGLSIFDLNTESFLPVNNDLDSNSKFSNAITSIFRDSRQILWIGTYLGVYTFDEINNRYDRSFLHNPDDVNSILNNSVSDICEDHQGKLWISTREHGLNYFDYEQNYFERFVCDNSGSGLLCNSIKCLLRDSSNVIWIGTKGEGLLKIDREENRFNHLSNPNAKTIDKELNVVRSIFIDSLQNYWIGTFYDGLFKCRINQNGSCTFENIPGIGKNKVTSIWEDGNKNLWITYQEFGICCYNLIEKKFIYQPTDLFLDKSNLNIIYAFCRHQYNPNLVWLGFAKTGLALFDISKHEFIESPVVPDELKVITIYFLYMDTKNNLWIGTSGNGLYRFNCDENELIHYCNIGNAIHSQSNTSVNCICEDRKGGIWIGTQNGLSRIDCDGKIETYSKKDGLSDNSILGIMFDESDNLWLSTYAGITKFEIAENSFRNYFKSDGIKNSEFNKGAFYLSEKGVMHFGGIDGITYFNPSNIKDNPYVPNIVLTDFQIFNESIIPSPDNHFLKKSIMNTKEINLTYKESVFSFEFAAMIFNNSSKNQYAYKMEGFDKDWIYCGTRRTATYTNLDPGEYTFRVKGSNNDGIWNEEGTSIKVTITPPWWQTWWFKSFGAGIILMAAGAGFKNRISKLQKEKKLQEDFSKKLLNSQEEERKKIASVLHDSIAQDVLITKNASVLGLKSSGESEKDKVLEEISNQSTSTLDELRRIQFSLHPYEIEKLGLTKAIKSMIGRVSKSTEIKFTFEEDIIDKVLSEENEIQLYRIIQEAINNIIKHSSATEALINISRTYESVKVIISDNGKGFIKKNALRKNSMGLSGMSERVKLLGGMLNIKSASGTSIEIIIPV